MHCGIPEGALLSLGQWNAHWSTHLPGPPRTQAALLPAAAPPDPDSSPRHLLLRGAAPGRFLGVGGPAEGAVPEAAPPRTAPGPDLPLSSWQPSPPFPRCSASPHPSSGPDVPQPGPRQLLQSRADQLFPRSSLLAQRFPARGAIVCLGPRRAVRGAQCSPSPGRCTVGPGAGGASWSSLGTCDWGRAKALTLIVSALYLGLQPWEENLSQRRRLWPFLEVTRVRPGPLTVVDCAVAGTWKDRGSRPDPGRPQGPLPAGA